MKIRYKGWHTGLNRLKDNLELLILGTPSSELRNRLTEINIKVMELEAFDKTQTEVR